MVLPLSVAERVNRQAGRKQESADSNSLAVLPTSLRRGPAPEQRWPIRSHLSPPPHWKGVADGRDEFCAYSDEPCMKILRGISPVSRPSEPSVMSTSLFGPTGSDTFKFKSVARASLCVEKAQQDTTLPQLHDGDQHRPCLCSIIAFTTIPPRKPEHYTCSPLHLPFLLYLFSASVL